MGPDLLSPLLNDHGNAERIIRVHGEDLRYCHAFKKWLVWDGRRWEVDRNGAACRLAKRALLAFLTQAADCGGNKDAEKFAKQSLDRRRVSSALEMAESEIFVDVSQLDTHPYLLNFKNGIVDLRTGKPSAHDRALFITKLVDYDYDPAAACPVFMAFLERIMGGGPDASESDLERAEQLMSYLQKAFGYSLTGITSEKAFFLAHGLKDNGKTTLLTTFKRLLPEYSCLIQIDSLMAKQESNNTQADLADLCGARFVMTSETEEGQRLAEGRLKRITQGMGRIKVARKYENPFEFDETHKLWIDANHKPAIKSGDAAIWRRLHLIPFTVTISPDDIDRDLWTKLLTEGSGILAWAVRGAVLWFREGLGCPREIAAAGAEYRREMDQIGRFIRDCCVELPNASAVARRLYSSYRQWAEENGQKPIDEAKFSQTMAEHGYSKRETRENNRYDGIGLKTEAECGG
jgi:putative DNA primase/helicase